MRRFPRGRLKQGEKVTFPGVFWSLLFFLSFAHQSFTESLPCAGRGGYNRMNRAGACSSELCVSQLSTSSGPGSFQT